MKKNLLSIIAVAITATLMLSQANAQVAMNASKINTDFTAPVNELNATSISATNVNFHAVKDFKKRFSTVADAAWYETDNGFLAKFTSAEVKTSVAYQKNGKWIYTVSRYAEKNMPSDVRAIVKRTYYDFTILGIEEIKVPNNENTIFLVHVQNATSLKLVRICDGEMQLLHDYKRG